ncbi:MAG: 2-phospho-L-lactate guanylyltransferase [Polyangiaceae bacterium]
MVSRSPRTPVRPVWAVVPAKSFVHGKSRLSPVLAAGERARFASELLAHTLAALVASGLDGVLVATDGDDVAALAVTHGASVLRDPGATGLAAVVDGALIEVAARGARAALVFMADLPDLTPEDVRQIVAALDGCDVVVVRDHKGPHTNALALAPPTAIRTCFGRADSFDAHCAAARAAGLSLAVVDNERIAFDVDAPSDHARLSGPPRVPPPAGPKAGGT